MWDERDGKSSEYDHYWKAGVTSCRGGRRGERESAGRGREGEMLKRSKNAKGRRRR